MIVSFALGILKIRPVWLLLVIAVGTALSYYGLQSSNAWRIEAGIAPANEGLGSMVAWTAAVNALSYGVGRGLRWCYDRLCAT